MIITLNHFMLKGGSLNYETKIAGTMFLGITNYY